MTGKLKWFNDSKGFGFIEQGAEGEDAVCLRTDISLDGVLKLDDGETVVFEVKRFHRDLHPQDVVFVSAPSMTPPSDATHHRATFLAGALPGEARNATWGMLAAALRAAVPLDEDTPPLVPFIEGRTRLSELLAPFASDFDNLEFKGADSDEKALTASRELFARVSKLLEEKLAGHRSMFPFGEITLDRNARVQAIRVKRTEASDPRLAKHRPSPQAVASAKSNSETRKA